MGRCLYEVATISAFVGPIQAVAGGWRLIVIQGILNLVD